MLDQKTSIDDFLNACAARQPVPGGGSVTALVGALAASMGEMVINYSLGKKDLEAYAGELRPLLAEMTRARGVLLELMVEDQSAYEALSALRKLPAGTPLREAQLPAALLASIRGPQAMGVTAVALLDLCDRVINFVNFQLLSDLAICADLSMAVARCAVYNVRVNLPGVTDPSERQRVEATIAQLLSRGAGLIQRVGPRIWQRFAQGV